MPGFSLLEFLIYFLITQIFLVMNLHWMVSQNILVKNQMHTCIRLIGLYAAHDALLDDVRKIDTGHVIIALNNSYVWKEGAVDVGWELDENQLYRCEGFYNYESQAWISRRKNLVADGIQIFKVVVHYDQLKNPVGISTVLNDAGDGNIQQYTKLRNGISS